MKLLVVFCGFLLARPAWAGWSIVEKDTGQIRAWQRAAAPTYDPATQALVEIADPPDHRTKRWDGAVGIRDATAQEIADYDAARATEKETADFDGQKMLKAVAIYYCQQVPGKTLAQCRADILTIYRSLP